MVTGGVGTVVAPLTKVGTVGVIDVTGVLFPERSVDAVEDTTRQVVPGP